MGSRGRGIERLDAPAGDRGERALGFSSTASFMPRSSPRGAPFRIPGRPARCVRTTRAGTPTATTAVRQVVRDHRARADHDVVPDRARRRAPWPPLRATRCRRARCPPRSAAARRRGRSVSSNSWPPPDEVGVGGEEAVAADRDRRAREDLGVEPDVHVVAQDDVAVLARQDGAPPEEDARRRCGFPRLVVPLASSTTRSSTTTPSPIWILSGCRSTTPWPNTTPRPTRPAPRDRGAGAGRDPARPAPRRTRGRWSRRAGGARGCGSPRRDPGTSGRPKHRLWKRLPGCPTAASRGSAAGGAGFDPVRKGL